MLSLFPATYLAYHRAQEGQAWSEPLPHGTWWGLYPWVTPTHKQTIVSDIRTPSRVWIQQGPGADCYSSARTNEACYWEDICRNRNVNRRGIFSFFLISLDSYFVERLQSAFHWKDSVDSVCMCVRSDMYLHMCVCVCVCAPRKQNECD